MLRLFVPVLFTLLAAAVAAQQPAPSAASPTGGLLQQGEKLLEAEDPVLAMESFRMLAGEPGARDAARLGMGKVHLMLGHADLALEHVENVLRTRPNDAEASALLVRSLIRARRFEEAVERGSNSLAQVPAPSAELLAASASSLFRVQRTGAAAHQYRGVLALEPLHAEANLRLGSGLGEPMEVKACTDLVAADQLRQRGRVDEAIALLQRLVAGEPNPVAHRLLGEALYQQRWEGSMAARERSFRLLNARLPVPVVPVGVTEFLVGYEELRGRRKLVADRALAMFGRHLPRILAIGGRHDLLAATERTTDHWSRRSLRGTRTFDGRVWDDVRGIGGLRAATGLEALDEADRFGFDTLVHEITHQVHYYALGQRDRLQIRRLYETAEREGRFLDYYAATNEAEYFGQGVEAFVSLAKRPGCESTHGHTRFELFRKDPALHEFVRKVVDVDVLSDPATRDGILHAAAEVALRCGRRDDAEVAVGWMGPGALREQVASRVQLAEVLADGR
ncbi:MAG: hypothetical protein RL148_2473 [Planctomycetota bacterium]